MLSNLPNLIALASGLIGLATLIGSWCRFRPAWVSLQEELEAGLPVNVVTVTIRDTTWRTSQVTSSATAIIMRPSFGERGIADRATALPLQPALTAPAAHPALRAAA